MKHDRQNESGSALLIVVIAIISIGALQWTAQRKMAGLQRELNMMRDVNDKRVLEEYVKRSIDCAKIETHPQNCNSSTKYILYNSLDQVFLPGSTPNPKIGNFEVVGFCRRLVAGGPRTIYLKIVDGLLAPRPQELIELCRFST